MWAPDDYGSAALAWEEGWGDLPYVTNRVPLPADVALGVLAHASLDRLRDLTARHAPRSVRLVWGAQFLDAARGLLTAGATPEELARIQTELLQPLESSFLRAGEDALDRQTLVTALAGLG